MKLRHIKLFYPTISCLIQILLRLLIMVFWVLTFVVLQEVANILGNVLTTCNIANCRNPEEHIRHPHWHENSKHLCYYNLLKYRNLGWGLSLSYHAGWERERWMWYFGAAPVGRGRRSYGKHRIIGVCPPKIPHSECILVFMNIGDFLSVHKIKLRFGGVVTQFFRVS